MKSELRRQYRGLRRAHCERLQPALQRGVAALLQGLNPPVGERHVGVFWPLVGEPDLRGLLACHELALALPAVQAGRLRYRAWSEGMELTPDACQILAPPAKLPELQPQQLAVLLVPALAVDHHGVRLGSGGGWYDRLRSDPAWRAVPALTVLPSACVVPALPRESWDVPFDGWIDEHGCHWITGAGF